MTVVAVEDVDAERASFVRLDDAIDVFVSTAGSCGRRRLAEAPEGREAAPSLSAGCALLEEDVCLADEAPKGPGREEPCEDASEVDGKKGEDDLKSFSVLGDRARGML